MSIVEKCLKSSVEWGVTGRSGFAKSDLYLLRLLTISFLSVGLLALTLSFLLPDLSQLAVKLQALRVVMAVSLWFCLVGIGVAIGTHPAMRNSGFAKSTLEFEGRDATRTSFETLHKFLMKIFVGLAFFGYIGFMFSSVTPIILDYVQPFFLFPGLALIATVIAFIPISYAAWTLKPDSTEY